VGRQVVLRVALPGVLLLAAACGSDPDPFDVTDAPGSPGDDATMEELAEELAEQREQLEPATGDIQQPAAVTVAGDLQGTYDGNAVCTLRGAELDIAFGGVVRDFTWTAGAPEDAAWIRMGLTISGWDGSGEYEGVGSLATPQDHTGAGTIGSASVRIDVIDETDLAGTTMYVIGGRFDGDYSGELGSGTVEGDLGVCNFR
jgi:hypothetical protein